MRHAATLLIVDATVLDGGRHDRPISPEPLGQSLAVGGVTRCLSVSGIHFGGEPLTHLQLPT